MIEGNDLNKLCWMLVNSAIDFEHRVYEYKTGADSASEYDRGYAGGMMNCDAMRIEDFKQMFDVDVIDRAYTYVDSREDVDLTVAPSWVLDEGYDPNPRFTRDGNGLFVSLEQELLDEYESEVMNDE